MADAGGKMGAEGAVTAEKNPDPAPRRGARFSGAWITARLDDDGLTVRVGGAATYGGRSVTTVEDLADADHLKAALAEALDGALDDIEARTMESAYEAAAIARRRGEE